MNINEVFAAVARAVPDARLTLRTHWIEALLVERGDYAITVTELGRDFVVRDVETERAVTVDAASVVATIAAKVGAA